MKITPAHDFNDFEVGRRQNCSQSNLYGTAKLNESVPEAYRGMDRFRARKKVVADWKHWGSSRRSSRIR